MGINTGSGLSGQLVATAEATYGVAPSLSSARGYEIKNESMQLKKTTVVGEGLAAGKVYLRSKRRVLTHYDCTGSVNMDLPTRQLAFWLQYMLGSFGQTNATPAEIGTTGIYKSIHQPGALLGHSFSMQKGVPAVDTAVVHPFTYVGCKISEWTLSCAVGAIAQFDMNIDARNELAGTGNNDPLNGSVPALATFGTPATGLGEEVFFFRQATLLSGGTPTLSSGVVSLSGATALANVSDASVKQSMAYDAQRYFIGNAGFKAEQVENNYRMMSGSFTAEFLDSEALYEAFSADNATSLELTFTGPSVSTSNYLLDVIIPNIRLDGESPKLSGPGVVKQTIAFTGYDDEATVPIQITYQSEDNAI